MYILPFGILDDMSNVSLVALSSCCITVKIESNCGRSMDLDWKSIRMGRSTDVGCHFMNDLAQCAPTEAIPVVGFSSLKPL